MADDDWLTGHTSKKAAPVVEDSTDWLKADGAPPSPPPMGNLEHAGKVASDYLSSGLATTIGMPKTITSLYTAGLNKLLPEEYQVKDALGHYLTGPEELKKTFSSLLPEGDEPRNNYERYGLLPIRALPMIAATVASGGAALPAIVGNSAGEAGGELGKQIFPDSWWGPMLGGFTASLGVAGAAKTAKNFFEAKQAAKDLKEASTGLTSAQAAVADAKYGNPEMLTSARNELKAAQDAADSQLSLAKQKQSALRDTVVSQAETQAQAQQAAAKQQLETTAGSLAPVKNLQEAGEFAQSEARNWLSKILPKKQTAAWAPVDAKIAAESPTPLIGTFKALRDINSDAGSLEEAAQLLKPQLPKSIQEVFDRVLVTPAGKAAKPAQMGPSSLLGPDGQPLLKEIAPAEAAKPVTWKDVQKFRSVLGDSLTNPVIIKSLGEQNANRIYAALTSDMKQTAYNLGANAEFEAANTASQRLYQLAQGPISKIVSGKTANLEHDPAAGKVANSFLNSGKLGDTDLAAVSSELPQVTKAFAAAHLRENIDNPAAWHKLSDQAKATLVPDPQLRAQLESAIDSHTQAPLRLKDIKLAAQAAHDNSIDSLVGESGLKLQAKQQDLRQLEQTTAAESLAKQKANDEAQANYARAKAAMENKPNVSDLAHATSRIGLGGAADLAFQLMQNSVSPASHLGLITGTALAGPYAYRGLKQVLSDPQMRQGLMGGLLGSETAAEANVNRKK